MNWLDQLTERVRVADARYGPFASTHEAAGVALEEWHEFIEALRMNHADSIAAEALDLAAVLVRMVESLEDESMRQRSGLK